MADRRLQVPEAAPRRTVAPYHVPVTSHHRGRLPSAPPVHAVLAGDFAGPGRVAVTVVLDERTRPKGDGASVKRLRVGLTALLALAPTRYVPSDALPWIGTVGAAPGEGTGWPGGAPSCRYDLRWVLDPRSTSNDTSPTRCTRTGCGRKNGLWCYNSLA